MIHMAGIIIATHGNMAKAMLESAELIVGKQENVETLFTYAFRVIFKQRYYEVKRLEEFM